MRHHKHGKKLIGAWIRICHKHGKLVGALINIWSMAKAPESKQQQGGTGTTTTEHQRGGCTQLAEISKENVVDEAKEKTGHLEQSLKAAIEIHKLEVEALRAESLAEAAEKETHQWMWDIIDRNPDLGHILNDPGTLQQTLDAARNPELMREMMRNTDLAMSNIEASPEGFNVLKCMYETIQEPLLNAATMGREGGNDLVSNPLLLFWALKELHKDTVKFQLQLTLLEQD
ncbi:unnamed protein product [Sphagnum tenellum]